MMKRALSYLFSAVVAAVFMATSCTDYGPRIDSMREQLEALSGECKTMNTNAEGLAKIIEALQAQDEMVAFCPIAEEGQVVGFKVTFKNAGEVILYNMISNVTVGEDGGKYYWMKSGEWMRDAAGNRIEISPDIDISEICIENVEKELIISVTEDAARVFFTLADDTVIIIPKYQALSIALEGDDVTIAAGETVEVAYTLSGTEEDQIVFSALCGDGWTVDVAQESATRGVITISAPSPITEEAVVIFAEDGQGRMVAVKLRLDIDTSGGDEPPTPPDPPTPQTILLPVQTAYTVAREGGEVVVGLITNVDYTVETDAEWLQYAGTKAVRTDNLAFYAEPNEGRSRTATATISAGNYSTTITFRQEGINRYLVISTESLDFDFEQESKLITISTNVEYTCEASDEWVTLTKVASSGSDRYIVSVADNTLFEPRTATVTVTGEGLAPKTVTIQQAAKRYYLSVSKEEISLPGSAGSDHITVRSNVDYSVSASAGWISVSGTPAQGEQSFSISVTENGSFEPRTATVTFSSPMAESRTIVVAQQGKKPPMPYTEGGSNLYTAPSSGFNYRYGPSIIRNSDGSLDVWTSKPGNNYLYYADNAFQDTGGRTKREAAGHTFAQYFNIQHKFAAIQLRLYGTASASDRIVINLYQWAGSYDATLAGTPIASRTFDNISNANLGNLYRTFKSDQTMMPAGEYLWTATEATEGVGLFSRAGEGTINLTAAVSYVDGAPVSDYNYEMKLRGYTKTNYQYVDKFAWWHSTDSGASWTGDRDVLFGTEGFEDEYSVCDPGAACFGGWYYLGYTSAPGKKTGYVEGYFNHCYLARSRTPLGPWYKWNGSGWGGEPAKVVEFTGDVREWGAGEPSIVVKDNTVYFYHSWVEGWQDGDVWTKASTRKTYVWTAPLSDDWPAHLTFRGVAFDETPLVSCDSADVKYVEDYGLFYAFHTYYRMTSSARIAVWTSLDGINFTYLGNMGGLLQAGANNMGVSGDGEGHIRLSEPQYVSYGYGVGTWGNWSTWFGPMFFE